MKWVLDQTDVIRLLGKALNRSLAEENVHFNIKMEEGIFEVHLDGINLEQAAATPPATITGATVQAVLEAPVSAFNETPATPEEDNEDFAGLHELSDALVASVGAVSARMDKDERPLGSNESYDFPGSSE